MAKIEGRDRLLAKLAALPPAVRSAIKQALAQGADEIVADAKRLAPKKTGKLRDSIKQTWGGGKERYASLSAGAKGDPDLTVVISAGNSAVRYAHLVEFGTSPHINGGMFAGSEHPGTEAQPFFFPAYRANRRKVRARISRATTKAAKRVASGAE
ncbi:HK97-gp10 family putative phage morphogenesis protein [Chelatococcus sp.]|uniref:HK97-gp10 family putative phage morphogenesis protein n=1 Tax=Chelatococcus sp. TaxID=1953771 RepID=UPI001ECDF5D7|nr:HK97-gp10 family putative phage morphogenesis protein [Chelatococcus sp.]MBX3494521.1 HK97 gp10 family phage protein [Parvibaculum sp.]MBX3543582.1 HK97 gp10 family phage protein [Chelatococcus sp.]